MTGVRTVAIKLAPAANGELSLAAVCLVRTEEALWAERGVVAALGVMRWELVPAADFGDACAVARAVRLGLAVSRQLESTNLPTGVSVSESVGGQGCPRVDY